MQYAMFPSLRDGTILLDVREYRQLNRGTLIPDEPVDEAAFVWKVVYGAFLPQPDLNPEVAIAQLSSFQGYGFGEITANRVCRVSEIRQIETFPFTKREHRIYVPCAVLIGTISDIPDPEESRALTLFPRFLGQMDVLTNVLNRPGVLALKGEEKEARKALNPNPKSTDWLCFVHKERAERIAAKCH